MTEPLRTPTRGAQRVDAGVAQSTAETRAEVGGYAASAPPSHGHLTQLSEAHVELAPPSLPEDDPFWHKYPGLDDLGDASGGNAASPPVVVHQVMAQVEPLEESTMGSGALGTASASSGAPVDQQQQRATTLAEYTYGSCAVHAT